MKSIHLKYWYQYRPQKSSPVRFWTVSLEESWQLKTVGNCFCKKNMTSVQTNILLPQKTDRFDKKILMRLINNDNQLQPYTIWLLWRIAMEGWSELCTHCLRSRGRSGVTHCNQKLNNTHSPFLLHLVIAAPSSITDENVVMSVFWHLLLHVHCVSLSWVSALVTTVFFLRKTPGSQGTYFLALSCRVPCRLLEPACFCNCAPAELILSSEVKCSKSIKFTHAVIA